MAFVKKRMKNITRDEREAGRIGGEGKQEQKKFSDKHLKVFGGKKRKKQCSYTAHVFLRHQKGHDIRFYLASCIHIEKQTDTVK